jgi:hypothetical protein
MLIVALLLVPVFAALLAWTVTCLVDTIAEWIAASSSGTRRRRDSTAPLH